MAPEVKSATAPLGQSSARMPTVITTAISPDHIRSATRPTRLLPAAICAEPGRSSVIPMKVTARRSLMRELRRCAACDEGSGWRTASVVRTDTWGLSGLLRGSSKQRSVSVSPARGPRRAVPRRARRPDSRTLVAMPPSRDDDLDWLYGRDRTQQPGPYAPEPTKVMPASPRSAPPSGNPSPTATAPPPSYGSAPSRNPAMPGYGRSPGGEPNLRPGPGGGSRAPGAPGWGPTAMPPARPRKRRSRVRTFFTVLGVALLVFIIGLIAIPVYAWSQVKRVDDGPAGERIADQPGRTFLLVGSDSREGLSKAEQKKLGTGSTAGKRTDTIMIVHVPPTGKPALISLPRDSYVPIPDHGQNRINAAYSFGGPELLVQTVEQNTGLRIDGYAEVGFGGFGSIVDAVGGVRRCLPSAIKNRDSHLNLKKGCQTLDGVNALGYVRMRKADPRGDLGRVERQRAVLGAVAKKAATPATVLNPVRYWRLNTSGAKAVRLGEDTTFVETASLANAMRKIAGGNGLTLTVPVATTSAFTPVGSAVLWDNTKAKAMFADIARGDTTKLSKYEK